MFQLSGFYCIGVVVKIRVPFWVSIIIRHDLGYPTRDPNFDNYPNVTPLYSTQLYLK